MLLSGTYADAIRRVTEMIDDTVCADEVTATQVVGKSLDLWPSGRASWCWGCPELGRAVSLLGDHGKV